MADPTASGGPDPDTKRYDAFISYSHAGERALAIEIQDALKRFDLPWYQRRALEIFRDDTALSVEPELWPSITANLDRSTWFVLIASPHSAQSIWVGREIDHWLTTQGSDGIVVVVATGDYRYDPEFQRFDPVADDAIHPVLQAAVVTDPIVVDLRGLVTRGAVDESDPRFRLAVAPIAARLRDTDPETLLARDTARRRRITLALRVAVILLGAFAAAAIVAGLVARAGQSEAAASRDEAVASQEIAEAQARTATSQALAAAATSTASGDGALALLVAAHAYDLEPTDETAAVLGQQLTNDTIRFLHGGAGNYVDVDLATDAPRVAAIDQHGTVLAWDTETGEPLFAIEGDGGNVAWSADGSLLMVADRSDQVRFYDGNGESVGEPLVTGHTSFMLSDAGGGPRGVTYCFRASLPKSTNCQTSGEIQAVADLHPDGRFVVVYDAATFELVAWDRTERRRVEAFTYPDGTERFDDHTGELILERAAVDLASGDRRPLTRAVPVVCSQAQLLAGPQDFDATLGWWIYGTAVVPYHESHGPTERPTLQCLPGSAVTGGESPEFVPVPITSNIRAVDLAPSGLIAYATEQPAVLLVRRGAGAARADVDAPIEEACAIAGRNLTVEEWARFAPGWPAEPLCLDEDGEPLPGPEATTDAAVRPALDDTPLAPYSTDRFETSEALTQAGFAVSGPCGLATSSSQLCGERYTNNRDEAVYELFADPAGPALYVHLAHDGSTWTVTDSHRDGAGSDPDWLVRLEEG